MVGPELGAGREDDLVVDAGVDADVGEAEHAGGDGGAVGDAEGGFEVVFAGVQRDADGPEHLVAEFEFADPDGFGAVGGLFDGVLDGDEGGGAVMVRDVPFDAAGDPCGEEAR